MMMAATEFNALDVRKFFRTYLRYDVTETFQASVSIYLWHIYDAPKFERSTCSDSCAKAYCESETTSVLHE